MQGHEEFYRAVSSLVAEATREGYAPWLRDLKAGERELPHDPITGQVFNNVNGQYLDVVAAKNGWSDPRWISSSEILAAGGHLAVKYGERPTFIARQNKYIHPTLGQTSGTEYIPVFNASQVKGLPPYEHGRLTRYIEERRENYEKNTDTAFITSQQITKLYFKQQQNSGLPDAQAVEPLARYYLALSTSSSYEAPEKDSPVKKLAYSKTVDEPLRTLYNASVYTNRITNPGFSFERETAPRRTIELDTERRTGLQHERGISR